MGDKILAFGKEYFYFVLIVAGTVIVIGCILNRQWATRIVSPSKLPEVRAFIEELHGVEARYKFERAVNMLCGIALLILGVVYWYFYG